MRASLISQIVVATAVTACGSTVANVPTSQPAGSAEGLGGTQSTVSTPAVPGPSAATSGGTTGVLTPGSTAATPGTAGQVLPTSTAKAVGRPVEVGVTVLISSQDGAARLGFGEFQTGDSAAQVRAVVKYLNAHGGLAGSPVTPVIFQVDGTTTERYDSLYQSICDSWTQDHHVVAGIYFRPMSSMVLPACMQKRGTPLIAVGQGNIGTDAFAQYPLMSTPIWPSMDRGYRALVERSAAQGFFRKGAKIGLLRFDTAAMKKTAEEQIKPALARLGIKVDREVAFSMPESTSDLGGISSQMSSAVLQFAAQGINEVIVEDFAALIGSLFPTAAKSGGYKPAHGYALTSDSLPAYIAPNSPPGQLDGAVGIGWSPSQAGVDVNSPQNPVRNSPAAQRCLTAMKAGQQDMSKASARQNAFVYCDLFFSLQQAVDAGGAATTAGYRLGLDRLQGGFRSALTFQTHFSPTQHDGPSAIRDLFYDRACACFRYRGGNRSL